MICVSNFLILSTEMPKHRRYANYLQGFVLWLWHNLDTQSARLLMLAV
jgi:hypothetical protein